jgi:hypothetical protein
MQGRSSSFAFSRGSFTLQEHGQSFCFSFFSGPPAFSTQQDFPGVTVSSALAEQQHNGLAIRNASSVAMMER